MSVALPGEVLIVRTGAIGDVVNALTLAAALKRCPTPPHIGWVVHDLAAPLVLNNSLIDRVHLWPRGDGLAGMRRLLSELRNRRYGLAVDLQRILKSAFVARASGAPRVLGWDRARAKEGAWLLARERLAPGDPGAHMVEHYGDFARHLGVEPVGPEGVLPIDPVCRATWRERAGAWRGAPVVLNLGASKAPNRWPPERFGALARELAEAGFQPLFTGGPGDREAAAQAQVAAGGAALDLVAKTSLPELAALLATAALFIGCDTGPMHMAVAAGCPALALFGPANPRRTGPYVAPGEEPRHRVLQHIPSGGDWRAAETASITAAEVVRTALEMLGFPCVPNQVQV